MAVSKQETTCNAAQSVRISPSDQAAPHPFANGLLLAKYRVTTEAVALTIHQFSARIG
jgi:hypothetical protein